MRELYRKYLLFSFVFLIVIITCAASGLADAVLVEAENFGDKGGWVVDQQFMQTMGSPYLLAHGLGEPVADAVTTVTFPSTGTYKMWVRTKDWVPGAWDAPGRFQVLIDGTAVGTTFGTIAGWTWQDGGLINVTSSQVQITLHDLTGFDGRCDAIYFDTDTSATPVDFDPAFPQTNRQWRNGLRGLPDTPPDGGQFDVVIVGGGISGCGAALAAERAGLQVALIHDRPLLGGNASSEIRVHTLGVHGKNSEILSQIDTDHYPNGSDESIDDQNIREATMAAAEEITIFSSHRAYDVQMDGNRIVSVDACSITTGEAVRIYSNVFIDCTGDGWIGYWAGADYRYGRESKNEFDEGWDGKGDIWSPEVADNRIMGSSILFTSSDRTTTSVFPEVPWAMDVAKTHSGTRGHWYWEYSANDKNAITDAEDIRDHLFRAIYGSFYNAKQLSSNAYRKLDWMGYLSGKRESRRLMGDYIYKQSDAMDGTEFNDTIAEEVRDVDLHYQLILTGGSSVDFRSYALFRNVPKYYIPFRCLYSRNVDNLMMAGRCFSCTHVALGGPRVMNTCGQMGIATGYAASLCVQYDINPRGVYENHIQELRDLIGYEPLPPDIRVIMKDGFDEAGDFAGNGWTVVSGGTGSDPGQWALSTSGAGNPDHYAWGGADNTSTPVDLVSGILYKDTGYTILAGDSLDLTFDIRDLAPTEHNSSILASLYYVDEGVDVVLGSIEYHDDDIEWGWHDAMGNMTVEATADSVGKNLMVKFEGGPSSHNGASAQRLGIDNVTIRALTHTPTVEAGNSILTMLGLANVPNGLTMNASVIGDGAASADVGWQAFDFEFGGGIAGNVAFDNITDPNTKVTISEAGHYILKLAASVGEPVETVSDQIEVIVYESGCGGAIAAGLWESEFDYDNNCIVNISDFAVFASAWLNTETLVDLQEFALAWLESTTMTESIYYMADVSPVSENALFAEYWTGVSGSSISNLLAHSDYPDSPDGAYFIVDEFRGKSDLNDVDDYGQRIRGYIVAPETGEYTFYIASDNSSQLFLSSDATSVNISKIAEVPGSNWTSEDQWDKYPEQTSTAIYLNAGQYYYIEVLHKGGGDPNSLSVGWKIPGETIIQVIPGSALRYGVP